MTGSELVFVLIGVGWSVAQLFRVIAVIEGE